MRTLGRYFPKNTGDERGAHFAFYDKPVMLLEEEFHDLVFTVCAPPWSRMHTQLDSYLCAHACVSATCVSARG